MRDCDPPASRPAARRPPSTSSPSPPSIGRDVDVPLVARAAGLDVAELPRTARPRRRRTGCSSRRPSPGTLRFSHALVREVLLDGLTPLRRARLHLQVADAIDAAGGAGRRRRSRSWPSTSGGPRRSASATGRRDALERAAEVAISRVAYVVAEELLGPAAQLRRAAGSSPRGAAGRARRVAAAARGDAGDPLLRRHRPGRAASARRSWPASSAIDDVHPQAGSGRSGRRCRRRAAWRRPSRWRGSTWPVGARPAAAGPRRRHTLYGVDEWTCGCILSAIEHLDEANVLLADAPPPEDAFEGEQRVIAECLRPLLPRRSR